MRPFTLSWIFEAHDSPSFHLGKDQVARGERAGMTVAEAVLRTRAYLSLETPIVQSRHQPTQHEVRGGIRGPIADVLAWHETRGSDLRREIARDRREEHAQVLDRFAMTPADTVLYSYEVHIALAHAR